MIKQRLFIHLASVLLLLVVQQIAISHALFHLHYDSITHEEDDDESHHSSLCDFHLAFAQVLSGNVPSKPLSITFVKSDVEQTVTHVYSFVNTFVRFLSARAPPVSLVPHKQ